MRSMGSHHKPNRGDTNNWLTPPHILAPLGKFDLDPCCPKKMPWKTADQMWSKNGLALPWDGRVWLNPPYGPEAADWLRKLAEHGNGIALIYARTETAWWFESVWPKATGVLFLLGRLYFHRPNGAKAKFNGGAPSALIAYGQYNALTLRDCKLPGRFVFL